MAKRKRHNPERRSWKGVSHKKGRARVKELRRKQDARVERVERKAETAG